MYSILFLETFIPLFSSEHKRDTDPDIVHQHLVEANGSERALDDVGNGCSGHNCRSKKETVTSEREAKSSMHLKILGTSFEPFGPQSEGYAVISFREAHIQLATPSDHDRVFLSH